MQIIASCEAMNSIKAYIITVVAILVAATTVCAATIPAVTQAEADSLERTIVSWNGRICPYGTMAHDVVLKLYGSTHPRGYTAAQVVASWQQAPDVWSRAPLIIVKDKRIREALGMSDKHTSLSFLLEHKDALQKLWDAETDKNSKLATALLETDERAGIALMVADGSICGQVSPDEPQLSDSRISAELFLVRTPFTYILMVGNMLLGVLFLFLAIVAARSEFLWRCGRVLLVVSVLTMCLVFGLRWYVQDYIPLTNGYETMLVWAMAMQAVMAFICMKRHELLLPFAYLLPGMTLLVAHLGEMTPQLTPLMPALHSPWLSSHVSTIMIAYALLTITFLLSVLALVQPRRKADKRLWLTQLGQRLLPPAVLLLAVGIVLGSVWAKTAWGAYWSWDPKETWALITFIVYAVPLLLRTLHSSFFTMQDVRIYNIYIMCAFASVLMTYFGVNYFLGGMHSYAN